MSDVLTKYASRIVFLLNCWATKEVFDDINFFNWKNLTILCTESSSCTHRDKKLTSINSFFAVCKKTGIKSGGQLIYLEESLDI